MRRIFAAVSLVLGSAGPLCAQSPDVQIKVDLRLHYRAPNGAEPTLRWYDAFGQSSRVTLSLMLEPGFRMVVGQTLQKIANSADQDLTEELYLEDPRLWRIGKQYLPFGRQTIFRETAVAARGETTFLLGGLPIVAAVFDNGNRRASGVSARFGSRIGLSGAMGKSLGAQATSLTLIRDPEDSPGVGRGYGLAVGIDFWKRIGTWSISAEGVGFRRGETPLDDDLDVTDIVFSHEPLPRVSFRAGWTREWQSGEDFFRAMATLPVYQHVTVEPYVRFREGAIRDGGFSVRVRF